MSRLTIFSRHRIIILMSFFISLAEDHPSEFSSNISPGAMSPEFGDGHSLKHYAPEVLACVIFDVYDQHTQIITELDVKLN